MIVFLLENTCYNVCACVQALMRLWVALEHQKGKLYELTEASTKCHLHVRSDSDHNSRCTRGLFVEEVSCVVYMICVEVVPCNMLSWDVL